MTLYRTLLLFTAIFSALITFLMLQPASLQDSSHQWTETPTLQQQNTFSESELLIVQSSSLVTLAYLDCGQNCHQLQIKPALEKVHHYSKFGI